MGRGLATAAAEAWRPPNAPPRKPPSRGGPRWAMLSPVGRPQLKEDDDDFKGPVGAEK